MNSRYHHVIALTFLVALGLGAPATGQERMVFDEEFVIDGVIQTPDVIIVIQRENLDKNYEFELKESFLDKIVLSLEEPPF